MLPLQEEQVRPFHEAGKLADLGLLDANPLEDIANTQRIRAVAAENRPDGE